MTSFDIVIISSGTDSVNDEGTDCLDGRETACCHDWKLKVRFLGWVMEEKWRKEVELL